MKKSLKRLIIDTATKYVYLSLVVNDKEIDWVYHIGDNNHSVTIMPLLESLLKKQNMSLKDLDQVIVGIGPGSYTGVRIGVTVAKMIAYLNNIDIYQVSSLALIASSFESDYILSLVDARRGNGFMAVFKQGNGKLIYERKDVLQNIESFKLSLDYPYEVVESGKPKIERLINSDLLVKFENVHKVVPNYLQVTEAERNLSK